MWPKDTEIARESFDKISEKYSAVKRWKYDVLKYFSPKDKANRLGSYLATPMSPHSEPSDPTFIEETDKFVDDFLKKPCETEIDFITFEKIKYYIKRTKNNKAPGIDGISNFVLKNLPVLVLEYIVEIYNVCFKLNYFPPTWKKLLSW